MKYKRTTLILKNDFGKAVGTLTTVCANGKTKITYNYSADKIEIATENKIYQITSNNTSIRGTYVDFAVRVYKNKKIIAKAFSSNAAKRYFEKLEIKDNVVTTKSIQTNSTINNNIGFEGRISNNNYYENEFPKAVAQSAENILDANNIRTKVQNIEENEETPIKQKVKEEKPIEEPIEEPKNSASPFFDSIQEQIDDIFEQFPKDEFLTNIIPSSKWAKVDTGENVSYSVGILTDGEDVLFIGYAVQGDYADEPPKELNKNAQFVPLDFTKPKEKGYWMMYQSAKDGSNV